MDKDILEILKEIRRDVKEIKNGKPPGELLHDKIIRECELLAVQNISPTTVYLGVREMAQFKLLLQRTPAEEVTDGRFNGLNVVPVNQKFYFDIV